MNARWLFLAPFALLLGGCHDMWQQPKYQPLQPSRFFDDGASARPLVQGVVARESPRVLTPADMGLVSAPQTSAPKTSAPMSSMLVNSNAGEMVSASDPTSSRVPSPSGAMSNANYVAKNPLRVTRALLERGRERYDINCSPCHGFDGSGQGMVIQRGFPNPPSFHIARLRNAPAGHFFDVISNGYGQMYSYADRVSPRDRWAIEAYIRALQRSQNATLADVPPARKAQLEAAP